MGRLNGNCSKDVTGVQQRLEDTLEQWRHRPDLCLMWVAFCTPSTLTLADGVSLAKTRRCTSEVLQLLTGVGVTNSDSDTSHSEGELAPKTVASSQGEVRGWRAPCQVAGGRREPVRLHSAEPLRSVLRRDCVPVPVGNHGASPELQSAAHGHAFAFAGVCRPCDTDPAYFRRCVDLTLRPWVTGEFAMVARLANSVHGEVRHLMARDGVHVVAKVVPFAAADRRAKQAESEQISWFGREGLPNVEDPWNELAVLAFLQRSCEQCPFLIRLQGMFQDVTATYLVTEYCDGGELFERVAHGDPLSESEKRRYVSQLLRAVQHLHRHNVGHRDISLENILLHQGNCVLMDFGQAVRLRAVDGTVLRYFAEAGKRMYRAPEMYVPHERPVQVVCPTGAVPGSVTQVSYDRCRCEVLLPRDAVPSRPCVAEPYGYAAAPADLFACGVSAFVLCVGKPPWTMACDADPTFSFIRRHGIPNLLHQWGGGGFYRPGTPPSDEESLLAQLLRVDPVLRPSVDECFHSPWLVSAIRADVQGSLSTLRPQ